MPFEPGKPRLPNLIIAGAPRCGTTSLHAMLSQHSEVFMIPKKELWFFYTESVWEKGEQWYKEQFSVQNGEKYVGEATPLYFCDPVSVRRMAETVPRANLLLCLRDPVERAFSHYWFNVRKSKETLGFRQAIESDVAGGRPWKLEKGALNYVSIGRYEVHLRNILEYFPSEQVHVLVFEELLQDFGRTIGDLLSSLGLDTRPSLALPSKNPDVWPRSVGIAAMYKDNTAKRAAGLLIPDALLERLKPLRDRLAFRSRPPIMAGEDRSFLIQIYEQSLRSLEKTLGREIQVWREKWA